MLPHILQCTGQPPTTKNYVKSQNIIRQALEETVVSYINSCLRIRRTRRSCQVGETLLSGRTATGDTGSQLTKATERKARKKREASVLPTQPPSHLFLFGGMRLFYSTLDE